MQVGAGCREGDVMWDQVLLTAGNSPPPPWSGSSQMTHINSCTLGSRFCWGSSVQVSILAAYDVSFMLGLDYQCFLLCVFCLVLFSYQLTIYRSTCLGTRHASLDQILRIYSSAIGSQPSCQSKTDILKV